MTKKYFSYILITALIILVISLILLNQSNNKFTNTNVIQPVDSQIISGSFDKSLFKSDTEWKKILTPEQYHILREKGTEIPFSGALDTEIRKGTYYSVGCNQPVFRSEQKYDSKNRLAQLFCSD